MRFDLSFWTELPDTACPLWGRVLVTTTTSLLLLDWTAQRTSRLHRGAGLYYGITRSSEGVYYVAARRRTPSSVQPPESERGQILCSADLVGFSPLFSPFPLRDLHGILALHDALYATCSRDNFVAIRRGDEWTRWYPLPEDQDAEEDLHHYNTIAFLEGLIWLVAHNHGQSELLAFAPDDLRLTRRVSIGKLAHNVWLEGEEVLTCSSEEGAVVGDRGFWKKVGGFPRGYVRLEDGRRILGINEYVPRAERDRTRSRLVIFSEDWRELATIPLEGEGMVLDLFLDRPILYGDTEGTRSNPP